LQSIVSELEAAQDLYVLEDFYTKSRLGKIVCIFYYFSLVDCTAFPHYSVRNTAHRRNALRSGQDN
jgi:hypothetical protein